MCIPSLHQNNLSLYEVSVIQVRAGICRVRWHKEDLFI